MEAMGVNTDEMSGMKSPFIPITEQDQVRLSILTLLEMDMEQAVVVMGFIDDSMLKHQLFVRFYNQQPHDTPVADRVAQAITLSKTALPLFL